MKAKAIFTLLLSLILSTGWGQQLTETFSWNGLKMNYPSNYIITKEASHGYSFSFTCEINDEEVTSVIIATFTNLDDYWMKKTTAELQEFCEDSSVDLEYFLRADEEEGIISNLKITPTEINTSLPYPNAYTDYSFIMHGVPIQGKSIDYVKGNHMVSYIMEAESSAYFKELEAIVKTISVSWGQQLPLTKTFSWNGLKMNYPANYIITNKEYDPDNGYSFSCEIDNNEALSMISVHFYNLEGLLDKKTTAELQELCKEKSVNIEYILRAEEKEETISNLEITPIKINTSLPYPNAYIDHSYIMHGVHIQGKSVTYIKGNYMVIYFMAALSSTYFKELEAIVKTISVN